MTQRPRESNRAFRANLPPTDDCKISQQLPHHRLSMTPPSLQCLLLKQKGLHAVPAVSGGAAALWPLVKPRTGRSRALPAAERFDFLGRTAVDSASPLMTAMQAWKIANPKEKRKNQAVSLQRARQWALPSMSGIPRGAADRYFRWHGAHAFSVTPESPPGPPQTSALQANRWDHARFAPTCKSEVDDA